MRVLHLATSMKGGAGVVAGNLVKLQRQAGHFAEVFTLSAAEDLDVFEKKRKVFTAAKATLNTMVSLSDTRPKWGQLTTHSTSSDLLDDIRRFEPEIVHIHNWFNLISIGEIGFIMREYPTVFHIHDSRLMTGGCHFTLDCNHFVKECKNCPATFAKKFLVERSHRQLSETFSKSHAYGLLFPSEWLMKDFENSVISKNALAKQKIMNPVSATQSTDRVEARTTSVVCVITDLSVAVKGFDLFLDAIEIIMEEGLLIRIRVVGENPTRQQIQRSESAGVELLGRLSNMLTLREIEQSDLLVVPSFSENSPTVVLEAQALGTLVLATDIAGNRELVEENVTGLICACNPKSMAEGIKRGLKGELSDELTSAAKLKSIKRTKSSLKQIDEVYLRVTKKFESLVSQ